MKRNGERILKLTTCKNLLFFLMLHLHFNNDITFFKVTFGMPVSISHIRIELFAAL